MKSKYKVTPAEMKPFVNKTPDEILSKLSTLLDKVKCKIFSNFGLTVERYYCDSWSWVEYQSGIPDYRGPEGFWKVYPPYKKDMLSFIDIANPKALKE